MSVGIVYGTMTVHISKKYSIFTYFRIGKERTNALNFDPFLLEDILPSHRFCHSVDAVFGHGVGRHLKVVGLDKGGHRGRVHYESAPSIALFLAHLFKGNVGSYHDTSLYKMMYFSKKKNNEKFVAKNL